MHERANRLRPVTALAAALMLTAASLAACASPREPNASQGGSNAGQNADLFAVVTGNDVDTLVRINVANETVTPVVVLEPNVAKPHVDGGMVSIPPVSYVLTDPDRSSPLLWTRPSDGPKVVVRELDSAAGAVHDVAGGPATSGVLPFLYEGKLAWASAPGPGDVGSRIVSTDAGLDIKIPGLVQAVVAGPGAGRISVAVIRPDNSDGIFVIDVARNEVTDLPTQRVSLGHRGSIGGGTLWADDDTLVASVFARIEPTVEDPENGEPDKRVSLLTWSVDGDGANPKAVAGLVSGPTLGTTEYYATLVASRDDQIAVITGVFDAPWVEAVKASSGEPAWKLDLVKAEWITAMTVSGTTLVVLQTSHVTFVDMSSGQGTTVDLGGTTGTSWVGR